MFGVYIECEDATDAKCFALVITKSTLEQEAHAFGPFMRKASQKLVVCSRSDWLNKQKLEAIIDMSINLPLDLWSRVLEKAHVSPK
jgi:hypothetical protein